MPGFRLTYLAVVGALWCQTIAPIRVDVRLVTASFTARDSKGALVSNLTKEEIELIDDGVPQTVSFFSKSVDMLLNLALIVDASGSQSHFVKDHEHDLK